MASTNNVDKNVYHEKIDESEADIERLLTERTHKYFRVSCPKALVNCMLQREALKQDSVFRVYPEELGSIFTHLNLGTYFKMDEIDEWIGGFKSDLLGQLLALDKVLHSINIFINPIEDITYTTLVEKPDCFVCLYNNGWVILRNITGEWYLLDPRTIPKHLTETYTNLIIMQMIKDKVPIFQLSGGEFARSPTAPENSSLSTSTNYHYLIPRVNSSSPSQQVIRHSNGNDLFDELVSRMSAVELGGTSNFDVTHGPPEDNTSCCVCLEGTPDHAFYPCGHQCICSQCKSNVLATFKECPICKQHVTDVIRIFKP